MAKKLGVWAFTIGIILALLAGMWSNPYFVPVLIVLGIVVGFLNVSKEETSQFLMSSVAVMIALYTAGSGVSNLSTLGVVGTYLTNVLTSINVFVFPATIVVAIKAIYDLAKN